MDETVLLEKISKLPDNLKGEVADFVDLLIAKSMGADAEKKPVFGSAKGMFKMSADFDEPLEDFKEYM